jgi:hypothetical protein
LDLLHFGVIRTDFDGANMSSPATISGSCLCGDVAFTVHGPLRPVIACHCSQCRKQTGSFVAATRADDVRFSADKTLRWFSSSEHAERGFCQKCGSGLFWRQKGRKGLSIFAGALDGPTGFVIEKHIYVADKPDWYDILDGKPQDQQWNP